MFYFVEFEEKTKKVWTDAKVLTAKEAKIELQKLKNELAESKKGDK